MAAKNDRNRAWRDKKCRLEHLFLNTKSQENVKEHSAAWGSYRVI